MTAEKVHLWALRAHKDHLRKAPRESPAKQKVGLVKALSAKMFILYVMVPIQLIQEPRQKFQGQEVLVQIDYYWFKC